MDIINIYKPSICGYPHLWKPHETSIYSLCMEHLPTFVSLSHFGGVNVGKQTVHGALVSLDPQNLA